MKLEIDVVSTLVAAIVVLLVGRVPGAGTPTGHAAAGSLADERAEQQDHGEADQRHDGHGDRPGL